MTLSETIEDIEAALNEAPICEYPDFTDAVREVLALARQAEALQRENAELREALKPFAAHKTADGLGGPDSLLYIPNNHPLLFNGLGNDARATVTVGDIRRARALIGGSENAGN